MARFLTSRRKPSNAIESKTVKQFTGNGASTINAASCQLEKHCAYRLKRRHLCIGATTVGRPYKTFPRETQVLESTSPTCPLREWTRGTPSSSLFIGWKRSAGKERTSR